MSQLIQLKQRIKAISSIKKITQTMRLISMSSHSKLKKQSDAMNNLKNEIKSILCSIAKHHPPHIPAHSKDKTLYIIFASEKGLCGTFNSTMFAFFKQQLTEEVIKHSDIISVGKKATQYLEDRNIKPLHEFDKVLPNKLNSIAQKLYETVLSIHDQYDKVVCLYSNPQSFFVQNAESMTIFPTSPDPCDVQEPLAMDEYEWPQNIEEVTQSLFHTLLKMNILHILTQSMLSEQSARFLSMDNATRSADNLQKSMKLTFNKMRQAKITRELIELIASF